jgi:hypothetical protein
MYNIYTTSTYSLLFMITYMLACTAEPPELLYDTKAVLDTVLGESLALYESCEIDEESPLGMNTGLGILLKDACSFDAVADCEQSESCESIPAQPPRCFQHPSKVNFCTQVCENDDGCPDDSVCISSKNHLGSTLKKLGVEQVSSGFNSTEKICISQDLIEKNQEKLIEILELNEDLPNEYDSCDPEADIDLCAAKYELDCLSGALSLDDCYPSVSNSPVKCRESPQKEDQYFCLRRCISTCKEDAMCIDQLCLTDAHTQKQ